MPNPAGPKPLPKVSCLCGADVRVDLQSGDRKVTCRACSSTFDFVVTIDSTRKNSKISLILPRAALGVSSPPPAAPSLGAAPAAAAPPPPPKVVARVPTKIPGKTLRGILASCECGERFPLVDDGELSSIQSCPHCRRSYHVAFRVESQTGQKTAMLAPSTGKARKTVVPPPSMKKTQRPSIKAMLCACGGLFSTPRGSTEAVCGGCGRTRAR